MDTNSKMFFTVRVISFVSDSTNGDFLLETRTSLYKRFMGSDLLDLSGSDKQFILTTSTLFDDQIDLELMCSW